MQLTVSGFNLHVLPAVARGAVWDAPVLGLGALCTGNAGGIAARLVLRNGGGAPLIETDADLNRAAETVAATVTLPSRGFGEWLAFAPPGLIPPGVKLEGNAAMRLHAKAQLPFGKQMEADWEVKTTPGRLTLPGQPQLLQFPGGALDGKGSLNGSDLRATARLALGENNPWAEILVDGAVDLETLKGRFTAKSPGADVAQLAALIPGPGVAFASSAPLKFEAGADFDLRNRGFENLRLQFDLPAARVNLSARSLDLPTVSATVTGRASPGVPGADARAAVRVKAIFASGVVSTDSSAEWDGKSGRLRVRSQSAPFDCNLLAGLIPRLSAGTVVVLPISWVLEFTEYEIRP